MELALIVAVVVVHLIFLYLVFREAGFVWFLACLFLPFLGLVVAYQYWADLKGIFLLEVALVIALAFAT